MKSRRMKQGHRTLHRSFTLLEIMLVIVIIIALAAVVVPNLGSRREQAKVGTTKIQLKSIEDALEYFKTDVGRYPTTEEGLQALNSSEQLQDEELVKKWHGPYLGKETKQFSLKDSWDHDYRYTCPGEHNPKTFDLFSAGTDGQEGTEDDIVNWEKEK
jgi:general secretion pathway protein G